MEKSFVMLKPGVLQRRLVGDVIKRFERCCLKIVAVKLMQISKELAEKHYAEHRGKDFYPSLIEYITSGPVVVMILQGTHAVKVIRKIAGATNPLEALPGTIRGDFALITQKNVIHASDSPESAAREISLFFKEEEIFDYELPNAKWVK
ncbi:MAG: nucleoside-diphosphate kinase [Spirochaetales bacterium]|nr:nucleoside-diphosphate kinase [Spirochaetales bacterium]